MNSLLIDTLADCIASDQPKKFVAKNGDYVFEINSNAREVFVNVLLDCSFGQVERQKIVKEKAWYYDKNQMKAPLALKFKAAELLNFIEEYPSKHTISREERYKVFSHIMEAEYQEMMKETVHIEHISELYDLVKDVQAVEYHVLVDWNRKLDFSSPNIDLNEYVLSLKGHVWSESRINSWDEYAEDYRDECEFYDDAIPAYCQALQSEEQPIPICLQILPKDKKGEDDNDSVLFHYGDVLSYLAVKNNRKALESLTPDEVNKHQAEHKPFYFIYVDNTYSQGVNQIDYDSYKLRIDIPEELDFDAAKQYIEERLLKEDMI